MRDGEDWSGNCENWSESLKIDLGRRCWDLGCGSVREECGNQCESQYFVTVSGNWGWKCVS